MGNYYEYKNEQYNCKNCGWNGLGEELEQDEVYDELFDVNCPQCHEHIGFVSFTIR